MKLRILFLAANPLDTSRLHLDNEFNHIDDMVQRTKYKNRFDLILRQGISPKKLQELFLRFEPEVVHFSGHGSDNGCLVFQNESGYHEAAKPGALGNLFRIFEGKIRCVVLNACYSEIQARRIQKYVDCIICVSNNIRDDVASVFATSFYCGIGYGKSIKQAFELGLNEIELSGIDDAQKHIKSIKLITKTDPSVIFLIR